MRKLWISIAFAWTILVFPHVNLMAHRSSIQDAISIVKALRATTHVAGRQLPLSEIDYEQLKANLRPAIDLSGTPLGTWLRVPLDSTSTNKGVPLYIFLHDGFSLAAATAPTSVDRETWWRASFKLTLDFLNHPETKRIYGTEFSESEPEGDARIIWSAAEWHLPGVRANLVKLNHLKSSDWGLLGRNTWIDSPGTVLIKSGILFVNFMALQKLGLPIRQTGLGLEVGRNKRMGTIPISIASTQSKRAAFRDRSGRTYVPILELHRLGLYEIQILRESQIVTVSPAAPSSQEKNLELPSRKPLP